MAFLTWVVSQEYQVSSISSQAVSNDKISMVLTKGNGKVIDLTSATPSKENKEGKN